MHVLSYIDGGMKGQSLKDDRGTPEFSCNTSLQGTGFGIMLSISEGGDESTGTSRNKGSEPWKALAAPLEFLPEDPSAPPSLH